MNAVRSLKNNKCHTLSVLMYSHDGFGLGHLKRNFNIANRLVKECPNARALLIMGHPSVPFHPIPQGIDFIKLPSIVKVQDECWQPRTLPMEPAQFREFRTALILRVIKYFTPDIFLVDYVPKGVWGELLQAFQVIRERGSGTRIVLGLRDIVDEPSLTRERWTKGGSYEVMREFYDKILIYGSPEVFDTALHYGLSGDLAKKISYCGYLCSEEAIRPRERVRNELRLMQNNLIVVTAGGGADAFPMMRQCMEALGVLRDKVQAEAIFFTGPFMHPAQKSELEQMAEGLPAKICTSSDEIVSYMNAADLLVTMGSYNTMMEALRVGRPTLVIPREGPSKEQQMRARIFSELGYVNAVLNPSVMTPHELAEAMLVTLESRPSKAPLNLNGLSSAVGHLRSCVDSDLGIVATDEQTMEIAY